MTTASAAMPRNRSRVSKRGTREQDTLLSLLRTGKKSMTQTGVQAALRSASGARMSDSANPAYRIKGETGEWEVVVGLEVHAQITATKSKLFSGAATAFG